MKSYFAKGLIFISILGLLSLTLACSAGDLSEDENTTVSKTHYVVFHSNGTDESDISLVKISEKTKLNYDMTLGTSAMISSAGGTVFVLETGTTGRLTAWDPDDFETPLWVESFPLTVTPKNLLAVSNDEVWVYFENSNDIIIYDGDGEEVETLDMSVYLASGDTDGLVDISCLCYSREYKYVFVGCGRLDTNTNTHYGSIVVPIDIDDYTAKPSLSLIAPMPVSMSYNEKYNKLYVLSEGLETPSAVAGGIEVFKVSTLVSEGLLKSSTNFDGKLVDFVTLNALCYVVVLDDDDETYKVYPLSLSTKEIFTELSHLTGGEISGMYILNRELAVLDRNACSIMYFDVATIGDEDYEGTVIVGLNTALSMTAITWND